MSATYRIVIVEDDALIAMDLADLLMAMGHDICAIASTESDAVAAALRWKPDLMIVDGALADGSGVSAMRQILARGFIPHLYVSGDPMQLLKAVPDAVVLAKPFTMHALANAMARAARVTGSD